MTDVFPDIQHPGLLEMSNQSSKLLVKEQHALNRKQEKQACLFVSHQLFLVLPIILLVLFGHVLIKSLSEFLKESEVSLMFEQWNHFNNPSFCTCTQPQHGFLFILFSAQSFPGQSSVKFVFIYFFKCMRRLSSELAFKATVFDRDEEDLQDVVFCFIDTQDIPGWRGECTATPPHRHLCRIRNYS